MCLHRLWTKSVHQIQIYQLLDEFQTTDIGHKKQHRKEVLIIHHFKEELRKAKQELRVKDNV